jgi:MFS transporter, OPA family, solute carrier family 37 (glycerol-3-phosphate transporter), member 1/2
MYIERLKGMENNATLSSGWAPFNGEDGTALLGEIDLAFLGVYAFGMFFAGHLGDRVDLRILLTIGMIGTGVFTSAFGAGYWFKIHNFYYFLGMQMIAGLFQSSGWPSVVAVVGNWFGKSKRGLHGNLERSYIRWKHIGLFNCCCNVEIWMVLVLHHSWYHDCSGWTHCISALAR